MAIVILLIASIMVMINQPVKAEVTTQVTWTLA